MKGDLPVISKTATPLGRAGLGYCGHIAAVSPIADYGLSSEEIERRLIELGFIEGAEVEVLHEGLIRHDPIAVRVDGTTVALRRREAMAILIK